MIWKAEEMAPQHLASTNGAAVAHGKVAYFSSGQDIYSFTLPNKWSKLSQSSKYKDFTMAIVNDKLTTIGGREDSKGSITNVLLSFAGVLWGKGWKELLPPMPTKRNLPAAVTTHSHLVVAGGWNTKHAGLPTVEVLNIGTKQWFTARSLPEISFAPEIAFSPQMALCEKQLYISCHNSVFSCSMKDLLKSCSKSSKGEDTLWAKLADTIQYNVSLVSLEEHLLSIGGNNRLDKIPTADIYCYNKSEDCWNVSGMIPSSRSRVLAAVLSGNKVIVVGGWDQHNIVTDDTYVGFLIDSAVLVS